MQKQISQANRHGLTIFQLALVPTLYFHYWKNIKEFSVFLLFDTCHNIYSKFEFRVFISAQILIKLSKLRCISSFFLFCFVGFCHPDLQIALSKRRTEKYRIFKKSKPKREDFWTKKINKMKGKRGTSIILQDSVPAELAYFFTV